MPREGSAALNNYGPTGSIEIARVAQPQLITSSGTSNEVIWQVWNDTYTNTMTITSTNVGMLTSNTVNAAIWTAWNTQFERQVITSMTTSATNLIGQQISTGTISQISTALNTAVWTAWNRTHEATAEQIQAAERQAHDYQARQDNIRVERGLAEKRAEKLLEEMLSPRQREELTAKGFFTLSTIAKSGEERIYRIKRGRSRNVDQVDANGRRIKTLCAHPMALVPDADTMLAQKLMLESQEEDFLRIANHS